MNAMVATMQVDEPIKGTCSGTKIYAILPISGNGQKKAEAPMSESEMIDLLNEKIEFIQENTTYNDKGMVGFIVNCKGEMVQCEMDNKTQNAELDAQIIAVLSELKEWKAASINGQAVDSSVLFSFNIVNGKFTS